MADSRLGKVQTVLGCVEPSSLGMTLPHEHLLLNANVIKKKFSPSDAPPVENRENVPFELSQYGWISRYPYSHKDNLILSDPDVAIEELKMFKVHGGGTIVDNTTYGVGRDVKAVRRIAEETGVHIIVGAGYYIDLVHPPDMTNRTEEQLYEEMMSQITEGCDGTNVKCGLIGEIGCSWPLTPNEKKVLRASALAQRHLGCAVNIHPGRSEDAPFEIIRILQEAGCDISKTTMSHLDRTLFSVEKVLEFASLGSFCEWDLFGIETSYYQHGREVDIPSDGQRIGYVQAMIAEGRSDQVLISHDVHTKHRLVKYGGHGYSHILCDIIPRLRQRGVSQSTIDEITVQNPQRWLTFTK